MTWIASHRWALLALVVLIPGALLAGMSVFWFRYQNHITQNPRIIAEGESGVFHSTAPDHPVADLDATLTLRSYDVVPWDSEAGERVGLLEGTEAISAVIHVDATGLRDDTFSCDADLVAHGDEGDRVWESAIGGDIDYYPSGDLEAYCDLSSSTAFDWEAVFVVPEGVGEQARLLIRDNGLSPRYQLQLEH